jgi:hypothetical protein
MRHIFVFVLGEVFFSMVRVLDLLGIVIEWKFFMRSDLEGEKFVGKIEGEFFGGIDDC